MFWLRMSAATIFFTALCSRTASPNASKILREGASDWTQY
ncbi:hypothetical protein H711_00455, partial [Brucella ovis IntaBari-2009-88-3]